MAEDTTTEEAETEAVQTMNSYEITAMRLFEMDFSDQLLQSFMDQVGADDPEEALEQVLLQKEMDHIQPEQKLLNVEVRADGPSNN